MHKMSLAGAAVEDCRTQLNGRCDEVELRETGDKTPGVPGDGGGGIVTQHQESFVKSAPIASSVELRFDSLTYTVSAGFRKGTKDILKNICGIFPPSQLIAIMGPSGAGKSSLLDCLSGYRISGLKGRVIVNSRERDLDEFRRISCYIQQDDRLQPLLTVRENMDIAADFKLGNRLDRSKKDALIRDILSTLGLNEAANTRSSMLSGGQKKRLSIALELINNPSVMFLDEPTTGLDSSSCSQVVSLLRLLTRQGRTIICTIHQPSASLFAMFDQVYLLSRGCCLYQGSTANLIPYLSKLNFPCPKYHNPADYVIELACGEYGEDKIGMLIEGSENGRTLEWMENQNLIEPIESCTDDRRSGGGLLCCKRKRGMQDTSFCYQLGVLLRRGCIKIKRDSTLTYMRLIVNVIVALMLGSIYINAGDDGSKVLDNYNLLFSILIHHVFSSMMLNILTFPMEMSIFLKEHFNRWYSFKAYFLSVNIIDLPVASLGCIIFSAIMYFMTGQPLETRRFLMFTGASLLTVYIAQSIGFIVGSIFSVVNGTFVGPTFVVPAMMFSGFGVSVKDIPRHLRWGAEVSYLRYALEAYVAAIYGMNRENLDCPDFYCHYRKPKKLLTEISLSGDRFGFDITALVGTLLAMRFAAYMLLRLKLWALR
ncbi:unnamed protein product [Bemisia tabaci]|uniref:ABC transporter domain-containing protein n=1 Tax=Bemisia tabaci TaxID=7038 RepID=A0A9P0CDA8_BEMTA|nr:unnamed protein product [Bemisia tabaci]